MKLIKKAVLLIIMAASMFNGGCMSQDEKAEKVILETLEKKYGEEFVLEGIGGGWGTMNNNTLKAYCYPKRDKTLSFYVEITKDLEKVYDDYLNICVGRNSVEPIEKLAQTVWSESRVDVANDTILSYPTHTDTTMSFQEFYKLYPHNWQLIDVFVKAPETVDVEAEVDRFEKFAELLKENKFLKSSITIVYLKPGAYEKYDEVLRTEPYILDYYDRNTDDNIYLVTGSHVYDDGRIEETRETLVTRFENWGKWGD